MPWPKFPADAQTIARSGPILPSPARAATATHVPRPLNERIGFDVSTLTMTGTPRRRDSPSWTYCGESRKTGSDLAVGGTDRGLGEFRGGDHRGCGSLVPAAQRETPEGTASP